MTITAKIESDRPVATLINVFTVEPQRQYELIALLAHATEETMKHQPGFICANFHASEDGERVINYAQWESEAHYRAMLNNPDARVHMEQAATIAIDVQPRLFRVASHHPKAGHSSPVNATAPTGTATHANAPTSGTSRDQAAAASGV
ncbi:antibiotic biosynthesis monooxygenase family protein [Streptomyces nodosus]